MVTTPHAGASDVDARGNRPSHVADLLRLITRDPGRPRLTWYGDDGERVELSGAVLENWVNKTTNLLVEEFDAGPGTRVVFDLPVHWRTVVWALAVWRVGATAVLVESTVPGDAPAVGADRPDVVVTTRPAAWTGAGAELVAVALPALARRFDGDLPPGAIDAASAVMTYGDRLGWTPQIEEDRVAIRTGDGSHTHAELVRPSRGGRVLLAAPKDVRATEGTAATLLRTLATWADAGSVVLVSESVVSTRGADPGWFRQLVASEGITDHTALPIIWEPPTAD